MLTFISKNGRTILVGQNARENDRITFSLAKPKDIWFHVKGLPGAHVILVNDVDNSTLLENDFGEAAQLALQHSSIRAAGVGLVEVARTIDVQKPRYARYGSVIVDSIIATISVKC